MTIVNRMRLKVKRLTETAKLPVKAHATDAGWDLFSDEDITIYVGQQAISEFISGPKLISTGLSMEIPDGYCGIIKDRSSMGKKGIFTLGGVIDGSYRGLIKIIMSSDHTVRIHKGDKIAQMLIVPVPECEVVEVDNLENTKRGEGGFGSTGK